MPQSGLRGLDLDAFCRKSPVWRFGPGRAQVVGCDVRINVHSLAERLGQSELLASGNAARVGEALAHGLLKSFLHPADTLRYRHFVHVPPALLNLPETWALLDQLPAVSRAALIMTVTARPERPQDLAFVAGQLADPGISVCLSGVDFTAVPRTRLPAGVIWMRGKVTTALDALAMEATLTTLAPAQAIAEPADDPAALQLALDVGFLHAVGPAAEAAARRPIGFAGRVRPTNGNCSPPPDRAAGAVQPGAARSTLAVHDAILSPRRVCR